MTNEDPLTLLKKHLTNIYEQIGRNEKTLTDFMQKTSKEVDILQREKLSAQEFSTFMDQFHKTLFNDLPYPKEKNAIVTADQLREEPNAKSDTDLKGTAPATPSPKSELLQSLELIEVQTVPQERVNQDYAGFAMKTVGEVFRVSEGIISVSGDAEIPSGTTVDKTLVVKGNFKTEENCRLLKDVKALRDITIGPNTKVDGILLAGGKITIGSRCNVNGTVESEGDVEIGEETVVDGVLRSKSSIRLNKNVTALQAVYAAKGLAVIKAT